jgi:hypothetical protein
MRTNDRCQNQKKQNGRSTLKSKVYTLVEFTNIIELEITDALKFQNGKFENCNCSKRN